MQKIAELKIARQDKDIEDSTRVLLKKNYYDNLM